jgi:formylglycine-generating enzyme required for sulfatase activity
MLAAGRLIGETRRVPEGMVHIPDGEFVMGSSRAEISKADGQSRGDTRHTVRLSAFYISKYLTTNAQYKLFCDAAGAQYRPGYWDKSSFNLEAKADHPVLWVGYNQAAAYCKWLSEKTGWTVSLPSEAQWERAARGATKTGDEYEYPWGNSTGLTDYQDRLNFNVLCAVKNGTPKTVQGTTYPYWPFVLRTQGEATMASNFKSVVYGEDDPNTPFDESGDEVKAVWKKIMDAGGCTTPFGTYPPGPEGCYDMAGNAFEWTTDYYTISSYIKLAEKMPDPCVNAESMLTENDKRSGSDGTHGGDGGGRPTKVIRGGSWYANEGSCKLHRRTETRPARNGGYHSVGFRVVMTLAR